MSAWCSSADRNAATIVGSLTFSPEFIPGMAFPGLGAEGRYATRRSQTDAGSAAGAGCAAAAVGAAAATLARYCAMVRSGP
jgi:hypothetical protein